MFLLHKASILGSLLISTLSGVNVSVWKGRLFNSPELLVIIPVPLGAVSKTAKTILVWLHTGTSWYKILSELQPQIMNLYIMHTDKVLIKATYLSHKQGAKSWWDYASQNVCVVTVRDLQLILSSTLLLCFILSESLHSGIGARSQYQKP